MIDLYDDVMNSHQYFVISYSKISIPKFSE